MPKSFWMVKQEPSAYSWDTFVKDNGTIWTGVRNFQARNNLKAMKKGDEVFFYHSVSEKAVVGVAKVVKSAYPDPTAKEGDWVAVDLRPVRPLKRPVTLDEMKANKALAGLTLLRHSRLSVIPVSEEHFHAILEMT